MACKAAMNKNLAIDRDHHPLGSGQPKKYHGRHLQKRNILTRGSAQYQCFSVDRPADATSRWWYIPNQLEDAFFAGDQRA
jgi:hypothetical protein